MALQIPSSIRTSHRQNIAFNNDWSSSPDAADISTTTAAVGAFILGVGSRDSAVLATLAPGTYTLRTWHTRLPVGAPTQEQALTVPATGTATASVRLTGLQP